MYMTGGKWIQRLHGLFQSLEKLLYFNSIKKDSHRHIQNQRLIFHWSEKNKLKHEINIFILKM